MLNKSLATKGGRNGRNDPGWEASRDLSGRPGASAGKGIPLTEEHQRLILERQPAFKSQKNHSGAVGCAHNMELNGSGDVFLKNSWTGPRVRSVTDGHL